MSVVIVSDEMGVYLGNAMGLGFWTLLDPAGQPEACVFPSVEAAKTHIAEWDENNDPSAYRFVPVDPARHYASIAQLKAAGLGDLLGSMEREMLTYADAAGRA